MSGALLLLFAAVATDGCAYMRKAVPAGAIVSETETVRGPCPGEPVPAKLRYDARRGVAIARFELAEGESIGRVYLPQRPDILPGDNITLVARIGHVTVRRDMTAMQPARTNEHLFVRDEDGQVVRAPRLARGEVR